MRQPSCGGANFTVGVVPAQTPERRRSRARHVMTCSARWLRGHGLWSQGAADYCFSSRRDRGHHQRLVRITIGPSGLPADILIHSKALGGRNLGPCPVPPALPFPSPPATLPGLTCGPRLSADRAVRKKSIIANHKSLNHEYIASVRRYVGRRVVSEAASASNESEEAVLCARLTQDERLLFWYFFRLKNFTAGVA